MPVTLNANSGPGAGATVAFGTGGFSETVGARTLQSTSVIDLGGGTSLLHFADSSANVWTGTLAVWNYSGTARVDGGTDQIFFGGNSAGLTAAQLDQITFYTDAGVMSMGSAMFATGGLGEAVPVPEARDVAGRGAVADGGGGRGHAADARKEAETGGAYVDRLKERTEESLCLADAAVRGKSRRSRGQPCPLFSGCRQIFCCRRHSRGRKSREETENLQRSRSSRVMINGLSRFGSAGLPLPMYPPELFPSLRLVRVACAVLGTMLLCVGTAHAQKGNPPTNPGGEVTPNLELKPAHLAARFLDQATAGATPEGIVSLAGAISARPNTAYADWLRAQYAKPAVPEDLSLTIYRASNGGHAKYDVAQGLRGSLMISDRTNELRRMVAYALSQIFVVSDDASPLSFNSEGTCDYYDLLYKHAFADFATILTEVTYHPAMSDFLSSEGNAKAGFYNKNSRPDENYAREVMQLFSIGLVQLNEDGSIVVDGRGRAIPTYSQPEVTEVARVFTGLKYPIGMTMTYLKGPDGKVTRGPALRPVKYGRDTLEEKRHDTGEKMFLGTSLPAGQSAAKDIEDFLRILCKHPNTAPFFAQGMIQRLVTSNPSPAYVKRVAQAFKASNGDMKTVISAILLDEEARNPAYAKRETHGKLREPWLRLTGLARGFRAIPAAAQPFYGDTARLSTLRLGQYPLSASSVFNFYLPNYQPPGTISDRNANATESTTLLAAPEFQIMNSNTALLTPNYLMDLLRTEPDKFRPGSGVFALDLTPQIKIASDPASLVSNVSTILTGGMMSDRTRNIITTAVEQIIPVSNPAVLKERARMAIYLTMASPDYAVQK